MLLHGHVGARVVRGTKAGTKHQFASPYLT